LAEPVPSERELEILKVLWELGAASVREVHERLCPKGELAFNTVQTQLRIMDKKRLVAHRAQGRTFVYTPRHSRERVTSRFLQRVFDGALDQLVLTVLRAQETGPEELRELEQLIAQARKAKRPRPKEGD
jgi:BlaI family penicillinase repressor